MQQFLQIGGLVLIFVVMYFLMIRPQRKRQKQVDEMRSNLSVGDKVVTIGGIRATITKVSDDDIVITVGADRVKLEVKRWAISTVEQASGEKSKPAEKEKDMAEREKELQDQQTAKPARMPRRIGGKPDDAATDEAAHAQSDKEE